MPTFAKIACRICSTFLLAPSTAVCRCKKESFTKVLYVPYQKVAPHSTALPSVQTRGSGIFYWSRSISVTCGPLAQHRPSEMWSKQKNQSGTQVLDEVQPTLHQISKSAAPAATRLPLTRLHCQPQLFTSFQPNYPFPMTRTVGLSRKGSVSQEFSTPGSKGGKERKKLISALLVENGQIIAATERNKLLPR